MRLFLLVLLLVIILAITLVVEGKPGKCKAKKKLKDKIKDKIKNNNGKMKMQKKKSATGEDELELWFGDDEGFVFQEKDKQRHEQGFKSECIFVGQDPNDPDTFAVISTCEHTKGGVLATAEGAFSFTGGEGEDDQYGELSEMDLGMMLGGESDEAFLSDEEARWIKKWDMETNDWTLLLMDDEDEVAYDDEPCQERSDVNIGSDNGDETASFVRRKRADPITAEKYLQITIYIDSFYWEAFKKLVGDNKTAIEKSAREHVELYVGVTRQLYLVSSMAPKVHIGIQDVIMWEEQPAALTNVSTEYGVGDYLDKFMAYAQPSTNQQDHASVWTPLFKGHTRHLGMAYNRAACTEQAASIVVAGVSSGRSYHYEGYVFAHELGHSLGMDHDNASNCGNETNTIMVPFNQGTPQVVWSSCSVNSFHAYLTLMNDYNDNCLEDSFTPTPSKMPLATPGPNSRESACHQYYGDCTRHAFHAYKASDRLCHKIYCTSSNNFESTGLYIGWPNAPSILEGTPCATGKVCRSGACVTEVTTKVDGCWSAWGKKSGFTAKKYDVCQSTSCDAADCQYDEQTLLFAEYRLCDSPPPNGGGKPCAGVNERVRACAGVSCAGKPKVEDRLKAYCVRAWPTSTFESVTIIACNMIECVFSEMKGHSKSSGYIPNGIPCPEGKGVCNNGVCLSACANNPEMYASTTAACH